MVTTTGTVEERRREEVEEVKEVKEMEQVVGWRVALAIAGAVSSLTPVALACSELNPRGGWMAKGLMAIGWIGWIGLAWSFGLLLLVTPMEAMALLWPLGLTAGLARRLREATKQEGKKT